MIKLIITDLDGTFLNSNGDYDREYFATIYHLIVEKGVHFAVCTGKQCEIVEELFGKYSSQIWIVGDSATHIKYNNEIIYQSFISNALGLRIIDTLKRVNLNHTIIACTPEGAFIQASLSQRLKDKIRRSYFNVIEVDDFNFLPHDFIKITVYDEEGNCFQTREHLTIFDKEAYIVVSDSQWIDIADYGVNKGTTIEKLQHILNITPDETMAFGDGYNDIELLSRSEYSFAMRNAFDQTKAVANFVIGSNDENSVLKTIKRILMLQY